MRIDLYLFIEGHLFDIVIAQKYKRAEVPARKVPVHGSKQNGDP